MATSDRGATTVHSQYDWSTSRPSIALVNAIAALENVDPIDLPVTLYDYINTEALDALVATDSRITISFPLDEYRIRIDGNELAITYD